jgi:hypothetical protein
VTSGHLSAPHLGAHDIEAELNRIYRGHHHRTNLVALFGSGKQATIAVLGQKFEVIPTRCELEFRASMPPIARDYEPGRVFLVDWAPRLPLDLSCRVAGQKLHRISSIARMGSMFGARQVDGFLQGSALAKVLLQAGPDDSWRGRLGKVSTQYLRREETYWRFLQAFSHANLERDAGLAEVLVWSATDDQGPSFAKRQESNDLWAELGRELEQFLVQQIGSMGGLAWKAWATGKGDALLQGMLLADALRQELGAHTYAEGWLESELAMLHQDWGKELLDHVSLIDKSLLDNLLNRLEIAATNSSRTLVRTTDRRVVNEKVRPAIRGIYLPCSFRNEEERFAAALDHIVNQERPNAAALDALHDSEIALSAHREDQHVRNRDQQRRQMALRLAYYLAALPVAQAGVGSVDHQRAITLADGYVKEGGYVDWARQILRGNCGNPVLGGVYARLLARVDALRRDDDRAFAQGIAKWIEVGAPSNQAIPMAELSKHVGTFMKEPHRRLLLLVMDGMSWANALELATSMSQESGHWGLAPWQPKGHRSREGFLPPLMATLPSLTNLSRAALFAGARPKTGKLPPTGDDARRWIENRHARKIAEDAGEDEPLLLLKNLATDKGSVAHDAIKAVASERKMVAVVINAIDDLLSGSDQVDVALSTETIAPLGPIIDAAVAAERAVLMVADHGHVPGALLESIGPVKSVGRDTGGARWRVLAEGEKPEEFEVELPAQAWSPSASARVAVIWDERKCYGQPKAGKHGGASLAEVVAPALLLVPDVLATSAAGIDDSELHALPMIPAPDWWDCRGIRPASTHSAVAAKKRRKKSEPPENQLALLEKPKQVVAMPPVAKTNERHPLVAALEKTPAFAEQAANQPKEDVAKALRALNAILEAGDRIADAPFARTLDISQFRIAGFVSSCLSPLLNYDGYSVVEYDRRGKQTIVSKEQLKQLFEIAG